MNSREKRWGGKEVVINIRVTHEETGTSEAYPIAAFTPDSIKWAETDEDGTTTWKELDIDNPDDEESLDTIRDTLDFLLEKS